MLGLVAAQRLAAVATVFQAGDLQVVAADQERGLS